MSSLWKQLLCVRVPRAGSRAHGSGVLATAAAGLGASEIKQERATGAEDPEVGAQQKHFTGARER